MTSPRSSRVTAALLSLAAVYGCAAKPEPPPPNVDVSARQCPTAPEFTGASSLVFDPSKEKDTVVTIDETASCIEDPRGAKSTYKVFALPQGAQPYLITVAADPWLGTIFAPRALLLDANGVIKRTTTRADFMFRGDVLSTILRSHDGESYLVVASDPEVVGQTFSRLTSNTQGNVVAAYPAVVTVYTGSETSTARTYTVGGKITVTIAPIPKTK